jgi:hypothetical protein
MLRLSGNSQVRHRLVVLLATASSLADGGFGSTTSSSGAAALYFPFHRAWSELSEFYRIAPDHFRFSVALPMHNPTNPPLPLLPFR